MRGALSLNFFFLHFFLEPAYLFVELLDLLVFKFIESVVGEHASGISVSDQLGLSYVKNVFGHIFDRPTRLEELARISVGSFDG